MFSVMILLSKCDILTKQSDSFTFWCDSLAIFNATINIKPSQYNVKVACYYAKLFCNNLIVSPALCRQIFEDQPGKKKKTHTFTFITVLHTFWRCGFFILGCWSNFTSSFSSYHHRVPRIRRQAGKCKPHVCRAVLIQVTWHQRGSSECDHLVSVWSDLMEKWLLTAGAVEVEHVSEFPRDDVGGIPGDWDRSGRHIQNGEILRWVLRGWNTQ